MINLEYQTFKSVLSIKYQWRINIDAIIKEIVMKKI